MCDSVHVDRNENYVQMKIQAKRRKTLIFTGILEKWCQHTLSQSAVEDYKCCKEHKQPELRTCSAGMFGVRNAQ